MRDNNLLPYDGDVFLIEDDCAEFDWPGITRKLMDIIPWQVEIARIFGRAMPVPRLVAWFGDITYSYSGTSLSRPRHSPKSSGAFAGAPRRFRVERSIPCYATFIEADTTALDGTATMSLALGAVRQ